ncbi:MAG: hypothetical protein N0A16_11730 [Blastocatellia bacterium]|nr:hypothetical protein [Blastocatellia bacterium]MCS7158385.1 hypothetical protein [Blastocatellia bacterium]MCX7752891.1 hypothetical protein [Blastocatellia bacterium]MDW8167947.1 hypothetical protein [Acidobacteriota bacterium]MDW8255972.1 hypothetical protein [Acidobacteriota bacterium]
MNESSATISLRLFARALWAPRDLASAIDEGRANWRFPAVVIIGALMAMDFLALPLFLRAVPQMAPVGLSPDMLMQLEQTARIMRPIQILLSPLTLLLKWAFTAAFLFGMGLLVLRPMVRADGESVRLAPMKKLFALVVAANIVLLLEEGLRHLLLWLRYLLTGEIMLRPAIGLDAFVRPSEAALAALAEQANVFEVWYLAVLIGGISALCRCSRSTAMAIVLPVWGFGVLAQMGVALIREVLMRQLGG